MCRGSCTRGRARARSWLAPRARRRRRRTRTCPCSRGRSPRRRGRRGRGCAASSALHLPLESMWRVADATGYGARVFPLNLPNALTVMRIMLVPVLVVALLGNTPAGDVLAAVVFVLASLTDFIDGRLAARRDRVTAVGELW